MIVSKIAGRAGTVPYGGRRVEHVELDNESRLKRVQRVRASSGEEIALKLDTTTGELNDGDVLALTDDTAYVVRSLPVDVLIIRPRSIKEALWVAHTLGNRHLQAQFFEPADDLGPEVGDGAMIVRYDHTVEHYLDHSGIDYSRDAVVMPTPFRHAEHTH